MGAAQAGHPHLNDGGLLGRATAQRSAETNPEAALRIACCQLDVAWEDKAANYSRARALLEQHRLPPGSLVILPELFATGFSMNVAAVGEPRGGPTEEFLARLAQDLGLFVVGGVACSDADGRGRNEAVAYSPEGRLLCRYAKMQLFSLGGEHQHYTAGEGIVLFDWLGCRVAPLICYDLRFPELFRAAVGRGAQLFLVLANWPAQRIGHWWKLLVARAIENQAYVAAVNRVGTDPKLVYPGASLIVDPLGEVLAEASDQPLVISADLELPKLEAWRHDFPALADMRRPPDPRCPR
jgi:predicted amidohydrolase